jgi:DNA-binding transcriptional LysR family regulator
MVFKRGILHYFVTVAEEGQMTRAAARLHMAQPALSQAISRMEDELGLELFERHARGVSLTPAGKALLPSAREAVATEADAAETARVLARAARGSLVVGFIGPPPPLSTPGLFAAFAEEHPEAEISYRDLPFPNRESSSWLRDVDVALCQPPDIGEGICREIVRSEARAAIVHGRHPLAGRSEVRVAEVIDDIFVAYHASVQAPWAAFHTLDDCRGGPPARTSGRGVLTTMEMATTILDGSAITVVPLTDAVVASQTLPDLVALPLIDAAPAEPALVWRADTPHHLVHDLVSCARNGIGDLASANGTRMRGAGLT